MASTSTYQRDAELSVYKNTASPALANVYVALYDGDPGRLGTGGTEVTTSVRPGGRVAIAAADWSAILASGSDRYIETTALVDFGFCNSAVNVDHVGLWDAASGGNFLEGTALASAIAVGAGDPFYFAIGAIKIKRP